MTTEIRAIQQIDFKNIVELMSELGYPIKLEELTNRLDLLQKHVDYEVLVVVKNNQVIGFAGVYKAIAFEFTGLYVRIAAFVISSKYRKQGIGTKLLKTCEEWAIEQGAVAITLNSGNREERQAAHTFYADNGYECKSTGFSKNIN